MTMTRQGKHHTVRSDLTGLTLLIITSKQSVTFYGKMYGKVQYRTPILSHVPVKDLSPSIYMMNYLTAKMMIIINNVIYLPKTGGDQFSCPYTYVPAPLGPRPCTPRSWFSP